jgi:hypothetical protein
LSPEYLSKDNLIYLHAVKQEISSSVDRQRALTSPPGTPGFLAVFLWPERADIDAALSPSALFMILRVIRDIEINS